MKNGKKYSNVSGIKNVLSEINDRYKENNQEDANEFISTFLDTILEDTKISLDEMPKIDINKDDIIETKAYDKIFRRFYKKKGGSFIVPLFYGLLKEEKICPKCNTKISVNFNTYNILEIPINEFKDKRRVNLKDIIDSFYGKEIEFIENESCSKCGEIEKVKIITTICTLPKYLIIHFRRTVNNRYIDLDIDYEDKIDFSQKMPKFSTDNKCEFNLCGVIFYNSSSFYSKYGHYTASCLCDKDWYHFNDSYIEIDKFPNIYKGEIILFFEKNSINLFIKDDANKYNINISINEKLKGVKDKYLKKSLINQKNIKFLFDKYACDENKTIKQLELDDGDELEII
jgi:ubiquitin C-terminal hydrolase